MGEAVRAALGSPVPVRRLPSSPRSRVWLVEFDGAPAIVKQLTDVPGAGQRYAREATALRLASRARPPVVPAVLAADPDERVLVLEYLAERGRGGEWMTDYATALARLHAVGSPADAGDAAGLEGAGPGRCRGVPRPGRPAAGPGAAGAAGGAARPARPAGPGRGAALLHGDPCPDNAVQGRDGIRFIDLEVADLGPGTAELAYLRIGWPTCWCATSVPEPVLSRAEAAYRSTWRSLTGTELHGNLADACAGWLDPRRRAGRAGRPRRIPPPMRLPDENWRWVSPPPASAYSPPHRGRWPGR